MAEFKTPDRRRASRGSTGTNLATTPKIVIPPSPLMKQLGYGTGVNVYLMERASSSHGSYNSPWAVKKISRVHAENGEYKRRLYAEASVLKSLSHPNIIGYRSYTHKDGLPCLVMESGECSLSTLIECREEADKGPFPPLSILKVARDVASGLKYLHEEKKLLHGDLKSANVLIKGNFKIAKLCDFGVSLKLNDKGVLCDADQCYVGTECWSPPEALEGGTITHKSDMFAYGLVLWEMIALHPPHVDKLRDEEEMEEEDGNATLDESLMCEEYYKVLGTRPCLPDIPLTEDYLPVLEIIYACTESEPDRRPKAGQVITMLDARENNTEQKEGTGGDGKLLEVLHEHL